MHSQRMKPDDRRRFFERDLKEAMPGARLISFKLLPEDMLDVSTVLRAELDSRWTDDRYRAAGSQW